MLESQLFYQSQLEMISGLIINAMIGNKWVIRRVISLDFIIWSGLAKELRWPCWTVEYMWREYAAVRNLINLIEIRERVVLEITEVISMISLRRLIDGGAAMLQAENKNHHMDIIGVTLINPLVRNILRVLVIS